jgi:hypothetical protein
MNCRRIKSTAISVRHNKLTKISNGTSVISSTTGAGAVVVLTTDAEDAGAGAEAVAVDSFVLPLLGDFGAGDEGAGAGAVTVDASAGAAIGADESATGVGGADTFIFT